MHQWPPNLQIFVTRDGSPTLCFQREDGYVEKMHHSAGAVSESFYIYHSAIAEVLRRAWPVHLMSIGLGLGYNELIAIGTLHLANVQDWKIWSFETVPFLRESFQSWLQEEASALQQTQDLVLQLISDRLNIRPETLKEATKRAISNGQLVLLESFPESAIAVQDCTCVLYDAYSKKMDPHLWDEYGLVEQLKTRISGNCVFSTYAATGSLNRALKALDFVPSARPGFEGKRQSTFAIRCIERERAC